MATKRTKSTAQIYNNNKNTNWQIKRVFFFFVFLGTKVKQVSDIHFRKWKVLRFCGLPLAYG